MHTITGQEFKNLIRGEGLTVKKICNKSGVSGSTATRLFKNEEISKGNYDKLVKAFDKLTKEG